MAGRREQGARGREYSVLSTQYSVLIFRVPRRKPQDRRPHFPLSSRILSSLNVCNRMDHPPVRSRSAGRKRDKPLVKPSTMGRATRPCCSRSPETAAVSSSPAACESVLRRYRSYWMAASAIDEGGAKLRSGQRDQTGLPSWTISVGATATGRGQLGSLVRGASLLRRGHGTRHAVHQRQDSLNNEFRPKVAAEPIAIPPSLLINESDK